MVMSKYGWIQLNWLPYLQLHLRDDYYYYYYYYSRILPEIKTLHWYYVPNISHISCVEQNKCYKINVAIVSVLQQKN